MSIMFFNTTSWIQFRIERVTRPRPIIQLRSLKIQLELLPLTIKNSKDLSRKETFNIILRESYQLLIVVRDTGVLLSPSMYSYPWG